MTIKEIEELTNLPRSNIRFYEKQKLICPTRNINNGYRDYSEDDASNIIKIAYLRTLGISIEDIRRILNKDAGLYDVIKKQKQNLEQQLSDLQNAKIICEKMLVSDEKINYENLDIEEYVVDMNDYRNKNNHIFKLDSVSFFYMWGGNIAWGIITIVCLIVAALSFNHLPMEIPIQWSNGVVSSLVDRKFIFAFPVACFIVRYLLHPFIWRWLKLNIIDSEPITNYITNYLCFIVLTTEIFIILYVNEIMRHVTVILFIDTFLLIGLLFISIYKLQRNK